MAAVCEHGAECHDGTEPSLASAPEASRAWLLIEHPGPWPHEAADAALPAPLRALVVSAVELGIRVQMIRRPGRRQVGDVRRVFAGWTAGREPWLRVGSVSAASPALTERDLKELAAGITPTFGSPADEPVFLVCTHGRRSTCCARFGAPLAQALAARHPGQIWETTHVGGHRFAANLVILPHGLYYGPVGLDAATAAIGAYQRGAVAPGRYRGRAWRAEAGPGSRARAAEPGRVPAARGTGVTGLTRQAPLLAEAAQQRFRPAVAAVLEVHQSFPSRKPTARPTATTAMPAQTSGLGAGPPSRTPVAAAATGATPVSRPAGWPPAAGHWNTTGRRPPP